MPTEEGLPEVGDVIVSPKFMFAKHSETGGFLTIVNISEHIPTTQLVLNGHEGEIHTRLAVYGTIVGDAYDSSRARAEFVVEEARWFGNMITVAVENCSTRWYVTARRLKANGAYDQGGERIIFFMCGLQDEFVLAPRDIEYTREMRIPKSRLAKA